MAKSLAIRKEFDMAELEEIEQEVEREIEEARSGHWIITRYRVTRCWGGPEEGGWWYDWYELDERTSSEGHYPWSAAILLRDEKNEQERPSTRFSVIGGPDMLWVLERQRGDTASTVRPRYE